MYVGATFVAPSTNVLGVVEEKAIQFNEFYRLFPQELKNLRMCFTSETRVRISTGCSVPIAAIRPGDLVLSFDPLADNGHGALVPKMVVRTFTNITEEWLRLTWTENGEHKELVTTPGHEFLTAHGGFPRIEQLMAGGTGTLVLADGRRLPSLPSVLSTARTQQKCSSGRKVTFCRKTAIWP